MAQEDNNEEKSCVKGNKSTFIYVVTNIPDKRDDYMSR